VVNTDICCALAVLRSLGLSLFAERSIIVSACTRYGAANAWGPN
jgi:hypothetical protein